MTHHRWLRGTDVGCSCADYSRRPSGQSHPPLLIRIHDAAVVFGLGVLGRWNFWIQRLARYVGGPDRFVGALVSHGALLIYGYKVCTAPGSRTSVPTDGARRL